MPKPASWLQQVVLDEDQLISRVERKRRRQSKDQIDSEALLRPGRTGASKDVTDWRKGSTKASWEEESPKELEEHLREQLSAA